MKKLYFPLASSLPVLIVLTVIICFYGAFNLIENGGGTSFGLPHDFLDTTMIVEHLFLGVIVFSAIGLFSIIVFIMLLFSKKYHKWIFISEGILLITWTIIQLLLLGFPFTPLHLLLVTFSIIYLSVAFLMGSTKVIPKKG